MPLAFSYQRVSTGAQAEADRSGFDRQNAALNDWLLSHPDYTLAATLLDAGVSAGHGKHRRTGALSRFINGVRTGAVPPGSCLVVESLTRFSREAERTVLETLLRDIWGAGVAIAVVADGGVPLTADLIDREPHRLFALLGAISQARREFEERQRRSKGACAKRRQQQDAGQSPPGRHPWWLVRVDDGFDLDPDRAAIVRRIVQLATDGLGSTRIAQQLHATGTPTPSGRSIWSPKAVQHLLHHTALLGTLERRDRSVRGYYPPVITEQQHQALLQAMQQRSKHSAAPAAIHTRNLFQGISRCVTCNGPIAYTRPNPNGRPEHRGYVHCRNAAHKVGCTGSSKVLRLDQFEAHVLTRLTMDTWASYLAGDATKAQQRLDAEAALTVAQQQLDKALDQLQRAERRAEDAWLSDDEETVATAQRAIARLRAAAADHQQQRDDAAEVLGRLTTAPQAEEVVAALRERTAAFLRGIATADADERLRFNRWLAARSPELRIVVDCGTKQVGLALGEAELDWQPVTHFALNALQHGAIHVKHAEGEVKTLADVRRIIEQTAGVPLERIQIELAPGKWVDLP